MMYSQGTTNVPFTFALTVDWTGWRRVVGDIPAGFSEPITLLRVYVVETSQTNKNAGQLDFDALAAQVGQQPDASEPPRPDPYVVEQGGVAGPSVDVRRPVRPAHQRRGRTWTPFQGGRRPSRWTRPSPAGPTSSSSTATSWTTTIPRTSSSPTDCCATMYRATCRSTGRRATTRPVCRRPEASTPSSKRPADPTGRSSTTRAPASSCWTPTPVTCVHRTGTRFRCCSPSWRRRRRDPSVTGVVVSFHHPLQDPSGAGASQLSDQLCGRPLQALAGGLPGELRQAHRTVHRSRAHRVGHPRRRSARGHHPGRGEDPVQLARPGRILRLDACRCRPAARSGEGRAAEPGNPQLAAGGDPTADRRDRVVGPRPGRSGPLGHGLCDRHHERVRPQVPAALSRRPSPGTGMPGSSSRTRRPKR